MSSGFIDDRKLLELAEGVGFEPTRTFALPVFKTGAINRSTTPPKSRPALFWHSPGTEQELPNAALPRSCAPSNLDYRDGQGDVAVMVMVIDDSAPQGSVTVRFTS